MVVGGVDEYSQLLLCGKSADRPCFTKFRSKARPDGKSAGEECLGASMKVGKCRSQLCDCVDNVGAVPRLAVQGTVLISACVGC